MGFHEGGNHEEPTSGTNCQLLGCLHETAYKLSCWSPKTNQQKLAYKLGLNYEDLELGKIIIKFVYIRAWQDGLVGEEAAAKSSDLSLIPGITLWRGLTPESCLTYAIAHQHIHMHACTLND